MVSMHHIRFNLFDHSLKLLKSRHINGVRTAEERAHSDYPEAMLTVIEYCFFLSL